MSMHKCADTFRFAVVTLALASVFALPAMGGNAQDKDAGKRFGGGKKSKQLVWPLPPEQPRLRFVQEIHGTADVEPNKKVSAMERIAGVRKREFKPIFVKPFGVAVDSKGRIFVSDNAQGIVFVMDREHHQVNYIGLMGPPKLGTPMGIHVDAKDRVWLADGTAQRIYAFDPDLNLRAALGKDELSNPVSVATDLSRNRLYVVDSKLHCVVVYDSETGKFITKFGKRGIEDGQFNFPTDIAVGLDGRLYIADAMNRRVQVFDADYKFLDKFGQEGLKWGQFRKPKSLALDEYQNVYVVDSDFCNFQIFDQKKDLLLFLGEYGDGPGQFEVPQQIRIDSQNLIYVVDQMNQRIQIFKLLNGATDTAAAAATPTPVSK
jgi:DNA-binding beta-propeller fold protein YncE